LVVQGVDGKAEIALNEHVLGQLAGSQRPGQNAESTAPSARFEITQLLRLQNVIAIVTTAPPDTDAPAGAIGSVRLEIEE